MENPYCSISDVENFLTTDVDASLESQVEAWIEAASRFVEKDTSRKFYVATGTRKFNGNDKTTLFIPDLLSLSSLKIDNTEISTYYLYPTNSTPKTYIELDQTSTKTLFTLGQQNIEITGVWGYSSSVPKDIRLVTAMLVAEAVKEGKEGGIIRAESIGGYSVSFEPIANKIFSIEKILKNYRRVLVDSIDAIAEYGWETKYE